jgi:adenylate cyclase
MSMDKADANRRLAAVLAADVVGYSRMMTTDEAGTLAALKRHREIVFDPAVAQNRGRLVKLIGDGALVEFSSVVDAVKCALAVQRAGPAPDANAIVLRIGINLGDVIVDGEDIYGEGVNVAARLEPLAEPGGICVSGIVNESVGNRIDATFRDCGEVAVKNIARPIRVWKWHPDGEQKQPGGEASSRATPEHEAPSIAVLPFNNISGDPEQEYFSDGITEDIITDLSKVAGLMVIARNSSFAYKGKSPDIRTVGRELGVRSVLEGSIRRAGSRVRITAQLINAANGAHLWAERYDRELTDIFAVQDEVTRHIVDALKVKLSPSEAAQIAGAPTKSIEAHDLFLRARELLLGRKKDREMFDQVVALLRRAIELDPDYAEPYAALAMAHGLDFQNHWSGASDAVELATQFSAVAIEKGPTSAYTHYMAAVVALWKRDFDRARREANAALKLSPNYALAYGALGFAEVFAGKPLTAVPLLEQAMRYDPMFAQQYMHFLGSAYLVAGKYEIAAATFRERIRLVPETDLSRGLLISALGHLGEVEEAQRAWDELKKINPNYSLADHLARLPFSDPAQAAKVKEGLTKAGLPV